MKTEFQKPPLQNYKWNNNLSIDTISEKDPIFKELARAEYPESKRYEIWFRGNLPTGSDIIIFYVKPNFTEWIDDINIWNRTIRWLTNKPKKDRIYYFLYYTWILRRKQFHINPKDGLYNFHTQKWQNFVRDTEITREMVRINKEIWMKMLWESEKTDLESTEIRKLDISLSLLKKYGLTNEQLIELKLVLGLSVEPHEISDRLMYKYM